MADYISNPATNELVALATSSSSPQVKELCTRWLAPLERESGENPFKLRDRMERVMWTKVGVVRNGPDMQAALPEIQEIRQRIKSAVGHGSPIYNAPWNETINTENLSFIAEMLTRSALAREESRGAHYRSDFPTQKLEWLKNICMKPLQNGDFETTMTPVDFTRLTPAELKAHRERAGLKTLPAIDDE